jgi:hypothetical protein
VIVQENYFNSAQERVRLTAGTAATCRIACRCFPASAAYLLPFLVADVYLLIRNGSGIRSTDKKVGIYEAQWMDDELVHVSQNSPTGIVKEVSSPLREALYYQSLIWRRSSILHDLTDTLIRTVSEGLSIKQHTRVTISIKLMSKPSILIFLDKPTSGLNSQSVYNTVKFLR